MQLRFLKLHCPMSPTRRGWACRQINGGVLVQGRGIERMAEQGAPTKITFPVEKIDLAEFGVKACKHVKSNAILLVREYAPDGYGVLGMGAGQPNRVDAVRKLALTKAWSTSGKAKPVMKPSAPLSRSN